jgi:hypothetical protein
MVWYKTASELSATVRTHASRTNVVRVNHGNLRKCTRIEEGPHCGVFNCRGNAMGAAPAKSGPSRRDREEFRVLVAMA